MQRSPKDDFEGSAVASGSWHPKAPNFDQARMAKSPNMADRSPDSCLRLLTMLQDVAGVQPFESI